MSLKDQAAKLSLKDLDAFGCGVEESFTDSEDEVADDDKAEHSELSSDDGGQAGTDCLRVTECEGGITKT